jgi:hypothetical protein
MRLKEHVWFIVWAISSIRDMSYSIAFAAMSRRNRAPLKSNLPKNFVGFPATGLFNG